MDFVKTHCQVDTNCWIANFQVKTIGKHLTAYICGPSMSLEATSQSLLQQGLTTSETLMTFALPTLGVPTKNSSLCLLTWLLTHSTWWHPDPYGRLRIQHWPQRQYQTWYSQYQRHWNLTSGTAPFAGRQPGEHSRQEGRPKQPWLHGRTGSTACRQACDLAQPNLLHFAYEGITMGAMGTGSCSACHITKPWQATCALPLNAAG